MPATLKRNERELAIGSWNMERGHDPARQVRDLELILNRFDRPEIIGCQEAKEYVVALRHAAPLFGYGVALPVGARGDVANNPILYRTDALTKRLVRNIPVHPGKAHAYPQRLITAAEFEWNGDGSTIAYDNTHLNSHIEVAGRPRNLPRIKLSSGHLRELAADTATRAKGYDLAFLGGDLNIDEDADNRVHWSGFPDAIFAHAGIRSVYDELHTPRTFDTHDSRKIDVIASVNRDQRVRALRVERLDTALLATDHDVVCATFAVRLLERHK